MHWSDSLPPQALPRVLDCAPDAMLIADAAGTILFASRQACALLGYQAGELCGCCIEQLMPERFRRQHAGYRDHFSAERRTRPMGTGLTLLACRRDGAEIPVEISLSPIRYGEQMLTVAAIRDVTEPQREQAELIATREAAEAARRNANEAREAANRANQAKSRFLATASHDLRQPLQSLALLNGTLRQLVREGDALTALSRQDEAIEAMSRLLSALLDISRLESGATKPTPADFPVAELFLAVCNEFCALTAARGLALEVTHSAHVVHSDRALVGQILHHLVTNAIQYTPHGHVRLSAETHSGRVCIHVEDSGIGIPPEELPRIYEEFYQIGSGHRGSGHRGSGLGLSIVRRLVRLLDLELEARSTVGHGTVFSLLLPGRESRPTSAQAPETTHSSACAEAPRVMVLEDDPAVRSATRLLLTVHGYDVLAVATIGEALEAAREQAIELLITDYHLSAGETGLQAINALRALLGPQLKAVLVTGDPHAAGGLERDTRLRLLGKPIHAEQLIGTVQALRGP
jgi:PAS domain S-box-containing protein